MYRREFEILIRKSLPKALLLYGEEYYLSLYLNLYKSRLKVGDEVLALYYDEYDFTQAKSYLSQTSLFGGTNLLLLRGSKALPKKELDTLVAFTNKGDSNYFLLLFDGEAKDAKRMQKSFESSDAVWVRFFAPNRKESIATLHKKAKEIGLKIEEEAISYLMDSMEYNLMLAMKELEKLSALNIPIGLKEIDRFVYSITSTEIDKFLFELFQKKPIIKTIFELLEGGKSEFDILRATQVYLNQIFLFNSYIKIYGNAPSSQVVLGYHLPKHLHEQRTALAMRIESERMTELYDHLLKSELRLKMARANSREVLLYGIMIELQRLL
jgi:DNA polymerase-3 subunit delta